MLRRTWMVCGVVALAAGAAGADSWEMPKTRYVKSKSARYRAVVVPGPDAEYASITLYDDRDAVHPKRLYKQKLVNPFAPYKTLVADGGQVITFDEWARVGYKHALVIYDKKGGVVVDCALEQLLLPGEIANVEQSTSSRWWRGRRESVWLDGGAINIKSPLGPVLRFDLATGAQTRHGQPFSVDGSDRCRPRKP